MKRKLSLSALLALSSLATSTAAVVSWDNGGPDTNWTTGLNWSNDVEPGTGDDVTIGDTFTVNYDRTDGSGSLPGGMILNIDGTLDQTGGVIRTSGATINVSSTGALTGSGFWDLNNSEITFADGASATMNSWENKGTNVFNFDLSAAGFATLTPNRFFIGGGATIANATYNVDLASYTGGTGIITLVDFGQDFAAMDDASFQGAGGLNILNAGGYTTNLQWNDTEESIELNITNIPEPSSLGLLGFGALLLAVRRRTSKRVA
ncbi:MAG: PEP-CTERM sorting domain-containing protein [Akkermansiaceae bacterium]|nr:PEP-CTERM sorting domain-containing protein [Akkermansiaceae bacterium]